MKTSSLVVSGVGLALLIMTGCSQSKTRTPSTVAPGTSSVGSSANPAGLSGAHGALVEAQAGAPTPLAFLQDGSDTPLELTDVTSLRAAGARLGSTLSLDADLVGNAAAVTAFTLDDVSASGRLEYVAASGGGTVFRANDGKVYEPIGAEAAALLAHPLDRPVFVSGTVDPAHTSTLRAGPGLVVTSWRPTREVTIRVHGGMLGYDNRVLIEDVDRRTTYRTSLTQVHWFNGINEDSWGNGILPQADADQLRAQVPPADLPSQPALFVGPPIMDAPLTTLVYEDVTGRFEVSIQIQATLPPAVQTLYDTLHALRRVLPRFRTLDHGPYSMILQPEVAATVGEGAFATLWSRHTNASRPSLYPDEVVVGAFMGRRNGGGHAIEVESLDRVGEDLYVTIRRDFPTPGQPQTANLPSPYHVVAIDTKGLTGDLYIDGTLVTPTRSLTPPPVFATR